MGKTYKHILVEEDTYWKLKQAKDLLRMKTWTDLMNAFLKEVEIEVPKDSGKWKTLNDLVSP